MSTSDETGNPAPAPKTFLLLHSVQLAPYLRACAVLLAVLLCLRWQGLPRLATHFIGGASRDAGLYIWLMQSIPRDLFELPWFHTQAFYPYAGSLAWSDNFILVGLAAAPLLALGLGLPLVFNLLLLAAQFLNGLCTYHLCFRLTGNHAPSLVAACAFMGLSYLSSNLGHPQLQFAFFIPAGIAALFSFFGRPSLRRALVVGLVASAAFLTTIYFSLFMLIAAAAIWVCIILIHPNHYSRSDFARFAVGTALGLSIIVPFLPPYLAARQTFGERALYEAHYFSATALSYLSFSPFSLLYRWTSGISHDEAFLGCGLFILLFCVFGFKRAFGVSHLRPLARTFIGFFFATCIFSLEGLHRIAFIPSQLPNYLCALSMWGALASLFMLLYRLGSLERELKVSFVTNRDLLAVFIALAAICFLISLGPQGNPEKGHLALGLQRVLYELIPGFNSVRAVSRIGVVSLLCLSIVLALALAHCRHHYKWRPRLLALIGFAIVLENMPFSIPVEAPLPPPPVLQTLKRHAAPQDAVLFLPMAPGIKPNGEVESWGDFAHVNTIYMNWIFPLNLPTLNGYSGQRSKLMREFPGQLARFPDTRSLQALATIAGLRFIVFSTQFSSNFSPHEFLAGIENARESLRYIEGDASGNYLFEYTGAQNLSMNSFSLWVPAWPRRILEFELKSLYDSTMSAVTVDVLIQDLIPDIAFHSVQIPADGQWSSHRFELPLSSDPIRPQRVTFQLSPPEAQVYLRSTRVLSAAIE